MQSLNRLKSKRPRKAYDFYETPPELAYEALDRLQEDENSFRLNNIWNPLENWVTHGLDAGAGNGVWGGQFKRVIWDTFSMGIDIQKSRFGEDEYDRFIIGDFLEFRHAPIFDIVYGNPPYSLAEEFVRHSHNLLAHDGYCYFLLRLAFLESKKRHFGLFTDWKPKRVYVLSRRPSFFTTKSGRKTTDALSYAMFLWQKGWTGDTTLDWLYWDYEK